MDKIPGGDHNLLMGGLSIVTKDYIIDLTEIINNMNYDHATRPCFPNNPPPTTIDLVLDGKTFEFVRIFENTKILVSPTTEFITGDNVYHEFSVSLNRGTEVKE